MRAIMSLILMQMLHLPLLRQRSKVLNNNIVKCEWFVRDGNNTKVILRLKQSNN